MVTEIAVRDDRVDVVLSTGEVVSAGRVVCAIPVAPLRLITISGLSDGRLQALRHVRNALTARIVAAYDLPLSVLAGARRQRLPLR